MVNLSDAQRAALEAVKRAHRTERETLARVEAEVREEIGRRCDAVRMTTAYAVRHAADAGVPLRQIGLDGLSTSDFATVRRRLALTEETTAATVALVVTGLRPPTEEERAAAGIYPGEDAVHTGEALAVRTDDGTGWALLGPDGTPRGAAGADLRARLESFSTTPDVGAGNAREIHTAP